MSRRIPPPVLAVAGIAVALIAGVTLIGTASSAATSTSVAREVHVPQLIGLSRDRAVADLRARHLHPSLRGIGKVVSQRPAAGRLVHPGTTVDARLRLPRHGALVVAHAARRLPVAPLLVTLGIATALAAEMAMARRRRSLVDHPSGELVNVERDKLSRVG